MNPLENIDFGTYEALRKLLETPNLDYNSLTRLDFSNTEHKDMPPRKALQKFPNLKVFILSKCSISRFDPLRLIQGAPLLQELDLSHNKISVLDDIIELGNLKHLRILNLGKNPVSKVFLRTKLIEFLLFPVKYRPYNAVKVLTATYHQIQNRSNLDPQAEEERKKFLRQLEKGEDEYEIEPGKISRISKYDHQDTLIKRTLMPCPVPRKTRFPMLKILNEEIISVQEMQCILMTDDISEILEDKRISKSHTASVIPTVDPNTHKRYIMQYKKKKEKIKEELKERKQKDAMEQLEQASSFDSGKPIIAERVRDYQEELWNRPADLKYKNVEFNIGITEFKKMVKDYEENKKKEKESSVSNDYFIKMSDKLSPKKQQAGKGKKEEVDDESWMDKDTRQLFKKKKSKVKPKLRIEIGNNVEMATSDSSVDELQDENEKEEWNENNAVKNTSDREEEVDAEEEKIPSSQDDSKDRIKLKGFSSKNLLRLVKKVNIVKPIQEDQESEKSRDKGSKDAEKESKNNTSVGEKVPKVNQSPSHINSSAGLSETKSATFSGLLNRSVTLQKEISSPVNKGKRGRRIVLVNERGPNLSLPLYERKCESKGPLQKGLSNHLTGKEGNSPEKKIDRHKSGSDLSMLAENKDSPLYSLLKDERKLMKQNTRDIETTVSTSYAKHEEGSISKHDKPTVSQPEQDPFSTTSTPMAQPASSKLTKNSKQALAEFLSSKVEISPSTTQDKSAVLFFDNSRAMDMLLPATNLKSFDQKRPQKDLRQSIDASSVNYANSGYQGDTSKRLAKTSYRQTRPQMSKGPQRVWEQESPGAVSPKPINSFKISTSMFSPHLKSRQNSVIQSPKEVPQLLQVKSADPRTVSQHNHIYHRPKALEIHSPKTMGSPTNEARQRFGEDSMVENMPHNMLSLELSPRISSQMSNKATTETPHSPILKNKKARNGTPKVVFQETVERPVTAVQKRVLAEDLVPKPEDGVGSSLRARLLNNRNPKSKQLTETAKMLEETDRIIRESNELADKIQKGKFSKIKQETVEPRVLGYDEITEFLRLYKNNRSLSFSDNKDVRELADLVNDCPKIDDRGMNKRDIEDKLSVLKKEVLDLNGPAFEAKTKDIQLLNKYLEILETIEGYRNNVRHASRFDNLLEKEINRAEHNAVLATHYLKLKKYCSQEYLNRFMDTEMKLLHRMEEDGVVGDAEMMSFKAFKEILTSNAKKEEEARKETEESIAQNEEINELLAKSKETHKKQESLASYIRRIAQEKNEMMNEYPYKKNSPVFTDTKHQWLNFTFVKKYSPRPMLRVEELTEIKKRKMMGELHEKEHQVLTAEEKAIKYAEEVKKETKQRRMLNAKVEKYIKEGTRNLDGLLESEKVGIPARFDKKKMFSEYMRLLWDQKL